MESDKNQITIGCLFVNLLIQCSVALVFNSLKIVCVLERKIEKS